MQLEAQSAADAILAEASAEATTTGQPSKLEVIFCKDAPTAISVLETVQPFARGFWISLAITFVLKVLGRLQEQYCKSNPVSETPEATTQP